MILIDLLLVIYDKKKPMFIEHYMFDIVEPFPRPALAEASGATGAEEVIVTACVACIVG